MAPIVIKMKNRYFLRAFCATILSIGVLPNAAAEQFVTIGAVYWDGSKLQDWQGVVPVSQIRTIKAELDGVPAVLAAGVVGRRGLLIEGNFEAKTSTLGIDPRRDEQWGLDRLDFGRYVYDGSGVVVAVVDTGVDATHPDLIGKVLPGYDVYDEKSNGQKDPNGHGTHVAGIIAATLGNEIGVAGLAPGVKVLPVRVLDETGYGDDTLVAKGVLWAVLNGAHIINLSLGGPDRDPLLAEAIEIAVGAGVAVVAAAGNDGLFGSPVSYPGAHPLVTSVAASAPNDTRALFSTIGSYVDITAPGISILSTWPKGSYSYQSGTSMATPFVSAATALVIQAKGLSPQAALKRLESSATDIGKKGIDPETGIGLVDVFAAIGDGVTRTIESRGKISTPKIPQLPELKLPRLEMPSLQPLPVLKLPPLPALTLPKLEMPKFIIPNSPISLNPILKPLLPPRSELPTIPSKPIKNKPVNSSSKRESTILKVTVYGSGEDRKVVVALQSANGSMARRNLTVRIGKIERSVITDAFGRAVISPAGKSGIIRYRGDRAYLPATAGW
jgi:hypothetical protein